MKQFRLGQCVSYSDEGLFYVVHKRRGEIVLLNLFGLRRTVLTPPRLSAVAIGTIRPADVPDAKRTFAARRKDNWWHFAVVVGKKMIIRAGCNNFRTTQAAAKHWRNRQREPSAYNKTLTVPFGRLGRTGAQKRVRYYRTPDAIKLRRIDAALNRWSLAFVAKVERARKAKARKAKT